ncbi:MarC family protein [Promicromonospora sp. CA-289599]|uniref:MarC family protein n=1 Tax=Promicromonospora sp. CA-289599 TaxID=3240014 RepID=UPI003D8EA83B
MSWFDVALFTEVFVTLFVIMDPPGTVPVFLALTSRMTAHDRKRAARTAIFVAFGVIVVFAVFGQLLLEHMGISLAALQASGGLLLLLVALELLMGKMDAGGTDAGGAAKNVALVPLATPLLAGPGTIVATMVFVQQGVSAGESATGHYASIGIGIVAVCVCTWAAMRFAGLVHRVLKDSGVTLVTRIAGVLLAAIATQMIANGVIEFVRMV